MPHDLTAFEQDQLKEIVNIGASQASTALSRLVRRKVNIGAPESFFGTVESAPRFVGNTEKIVTVVLLKMLGDVEGLTMMVLPPPGAANLAGLLRQREKVAVKEAAVLEEMDRSALKEAGNIATGSALTAFSKLMGFRLLQSVPDDATDMSGSVMDGIIAEMGRASDRILAVRVGFGIDGENIDGALLFIFDPAASRKIIDAVGRTMARPKR